MDFETAKAKKKPNTATVPIALDPEWAGRLGVAAGKLAVAKDALAVVQRILDSLPPMTYENDVALQRAEVVAAQQQVDDAQAAHDALVADTDANVVKFKLRALSANEVDDLRAQYPPTPEQKEEARKNKSPAPQWNYELYNPALVHAALVEPHWSLEQIVEIWNDDNWNVAELRQLYGTADQLTSTMQVVDLGED